MTRHFPREFLWGASTAGHQIEGGNSNSDTWFLEQQTPTVFREPSGAACNSFELWETDLDLAAGLGLDAYRFSVEWARVEPEPGHFDTGAIEHYEAIVDGCLDRGLAPVVTFNHFTAPHWFAARGGFIDDDAPATFARYCGRVAHAFGDRISHAVTLNEPNLHRLLDWLGLPDFVRDLERATLDGAARAAEVEHYRAGNVVVPEDHEGMQQGLTAAHRAAVSAIKDHRADLPVGWSITIVDNYAVGDDTSVRDAKRAELYDHYLDVSADDDFIGVQNYERRWYDAEGEVVRDPDAPTNNMGSAIDPASLGGAVRYSYERSGVPVLVTEHGMHTSDDSLRAAFIEPSLAGLLDAIADGVPVLGYLHWSLMDNFEWIFGFEPQLGLMSVDRTTFVRTRKPSADVYERIVRAGAIEL